MNHRHLLPNEIDLLVDGELGFGMAPLRAHVAECADCRAEVESARRVAEALEELPHFAPSFGFADRVMTEVPVFVPWHVAARDSLARLAPASRPLRVLVLAGATSVASVLTLGILWLATRGDLLVFASGLLSDRVRDLVATAARDAAAAVFGEQFLIALQQTGAIGIALAAAGFLAAAAGTIAGLRRIAASNRGS